MRRLLLVAGSILIVVAAAIAAALNEAERRERPELQRVLDGLVEGPGRVAPGVAAFVGGPGGTWSGSAGVADAGARTPMAPDVRVRLESVSKIWVAALVLLLAEDGRLALGDTVERLLPGLLPFGGRITLRQLLNHTSGLFNTNDVTQSTAERVLAAVDDPEVRAEFLRLAAAAERDPAFEFPPAKWVQLAATQQLAFEPGTGFHYSNVGYEVLGLVAEKAGGAPLAELLDERIVRPLGLERTAYDPAADISGPHASGYSVGEGGRLTDTTRWTRGVGAAGGIVSDARDTARFLQTLMRGELLGPEWLAAMREPAAAAGSYGLGIGVAPSGCAGFAYGHNGGGDGFTTSVWVSRDGSRVAVLLANGRAGPRGDQAVSAAMRELYCAA